MKLFMGASAELDEYVVKIGASNYTLPNKAILIHTPDKELTSAVKYLEDNFYLPDDANAREAVMQKLCFGVPNIINAQYEVMAVAAVGILSTGELIRHDGDFAGTTYVVLIYDSYGSVTTFRKSGEGVVSAYSSFISLTGELKKAAAGETVTEYLSKMFNADKIEVEYVDGDGIEKYR
jgi:hypothetical protein